MSNLLTLCCFAEIELELPEEKQPVQAQQVHRVKVCQKGGRVLAFNAATQTLSARSAKTAKGACVHSIAADLECTECKDSKGACVHSTATDLECTECSECKGRTEGSMRAFNCRNADLDCKECRDKR